MPKWDRRDGIRGNSGSVIPVAEARGEGRLSQDVLPGHPGGPSEGQAALDVAALRLAPHLPARCRYRGKLDSGF